MLVVGLTGGIGSGKSAVSALLAARGAVIVDADVLARQVVEPGGAAYQGVVERFGSSVVRDDGTLDRPALAEIVFSDRAALEDLNALTHPPVKALIAERLAEQSSGDAVVVLVIPLLAESGRYPVAGVLVVDCPEEVAVARLVEHRGMSEAAARRRLAAQVRRADRLAIADHVIANDGSLDDLAVEVDRAWAWIEELRARDRGET
ncbi:MAG: dephospho-CoA kinase, partial [Actinomycetota bacterium]|nr:dephospho-CoA kinase [Actinomycetota bacterium]